MRSIKYNIYAFNWCKNCRHRLARFSVIDKKNCDEAIYLHVLSCCILKLTCFFKLFPILTHVLISAAQLMAAVDLNVGRCRQLIEFMKVCEYSRSMSF